MENLETRLNDYKLISTKGRGILGLYLTDFFRENTSVRELLLVKNSIIYPEYDIYIPKQNLILPKINSTYKFNELVNLNELKIHIEILTSDLHKPGEILICKRGDVGPLYFIYTNDK